MDIPTAHARLPPKKDLWVDDGWNYGRKPRRGPTGREKVPRLSESRRFPNSLVDSALLMMCRMVRLNNGKRLDPPRSLMVIVLFTKSVGGGCIDTSSCLTFSAACTKLLSSGQDCLGTPRRHAIFSSAVSLVVSPQQCCSQETTKNSKRPHVPDCCLIGTRWAPKAKCCQEYSKCCRELKTCPGKTIQEPCRSTTPSTSRYRQTDGSQKIQDGRCCEEQNAHAHLIYMQAAEQGSPSRSKDSLVKSPVTKFQPCHPSVFLPTRMVEAQPTQRATNSTISPMEQECHVGSLGELAEGAARTVPRMASPK